MLERELQAEREARRTGAPMVAAPPEAAPMAPVGSNGGGGSSEAAPSGSPPPTPAEAGAEQGDNKQKLVGLAAVFAACLSSGQYIFQN